MSDARMRALEREAITDPEAAARLDRERRRAEDPRRHYLVGYTATGRKAHLARAEVGHLLHPSPGLLTAACGSAALQRLQWAPAIEGDWHALEGIDAPGGLCASCSLWIGRRSMLTLWSWQVALAHVDESIEGYPKLDAPGVRSALAMAECALAERGRWVAERGRWVNLVRGLEADVKAATGRAP